MDGILLRKDREWWYSQRDENFFEAKINLWEKGIVENVKMKTDVAKSYARRKTWAVCSWNNRHPLQLLYVNFTQNTVAQEQDFYC